MRDLKHQQKIKLLLLSGASLVGRNILDMLTDRRNEVQLIATNSIIDDPTLYEFDKVYKTSITLGDSNQFEKKVLGIVDTEQPDLIIPCRDDDVIFLAGLRDRRPDLAHRIVCGNSDTAQATYDKYESWNFSRNYDLPFVPTMTNPSDEQALEFVRRYGFPLLAKPKTGFASRGVFIICNESQLLLLAKDTNYIIQKFLGEQEIINRYLDTLKTTGLPLHHSFEGVKHSIQIWIAPDGTPAGYFCTRNVNRNGTSLSLERYHGDDAKNLGMMCMRAFSEAGWRGPVNIQCQKAPDGQLYIYEYNGRISGASAARYFMGFDEMGILIRCFLKRELSDVPHSINKKVFRYMTDRIIPDQARTELETKGFWQKKENIKSNKV